MLGNEYKANITENFIEVLRELGEDENSEYMLRLKHELERYRRKQALDTQSSGQHNGHASAYASACK